MLKNTYPGKFIVFEGIDGSGKSTQTKMLSVYLQNKGYQVEKIDFPQHGEPSSALVDEYLRGAYGTAEEVGPYRASIFYACDRYAASFKIKKWLNEGKVVVADRYMVSNMGHQGGKIRDKKEREKYFKWLYDLEYGIFNIPKPNYTIILKTSPEFSLKLAHSITDKTKKARRKSYLGKVKRDIHEKDKNHLANALESFLHVASIYPAEFRVVECLKGGNLMPPEIIHKKVANIVDTLL